MHYRGWDDEFVLYAPHTGATHLLSAPAVHLLEQLRPGARSEPALAAALAAAFDLEPGMDLGQEVATLLAHLQALYLVEPA